LSYEGRPTDYQGRAHDSLKKELEDVAGEFTLSLPRNFRGNKSLSAENWNPSSPSTARPGTTDTDSGAGLRGRQIFPQSVINGDISAGEAHPSRLGASPTFHAVRA